MGSGSQRFHRRLYSPRKQSRSPHIRPRCKDQYDRFLAFVWNGDVLLNEELVRAGLAQAKLGYRYSGAMKNRLAKAQDDARQARRGIWSKPGREPAENE